MHAVVRPSISRRSSSSADTTEVACVPLPPDVDAAFVFIIRTIPKTDATVQTDVGIRFQDCLDDDFVNTVEHADVKIDASKMFPGGKVAVQRAQSLKRMADGDAEAHKRPKKSRILM